MKEIIIGTKGNAEIIAEKSTLAVNVGSGSLEVFATPMMAMLMEKSACNALADFMENDETSVGTELNIKHISATPESMKVTASAEITEANGREITFKVEAFDESGKIGEGLHKRFIVYSERFTEKAKSKLK